MVNRANPPKITIPTKLRVKDSVVTTTAKGVDIHSLIFNEYDVIRVSFVFRAGTKYQTTPFCATSVAGMLSEGSEGVSAREISEIMDFYGIYYDHSTDRDHTVITICTLERRFNEGIELLRKILTTPAFSAEEFDIYRQKRKSSIELQRAKIDFIAREEFAKALFGENHYYGRSHHESFMDNLTTDDIKEFYSSYYNCNNLFVVCSGKLSSEHIDAVSSLADTLPVGKKSEYQISEVRSSHNLFIPWEGANQSVIRVGCLLFPRSHPDFVAMQVVAMVLGGYFGSRLISNLREEKGYTYGVFAGVINLEDSGYLGISTEVESSVTESALEEIYKEVERMRVELITEEELQVIRRVMIGEMLRILDGPFGIADITIENVLNDRDNSYLNSQLNEIMAITPERILEVANRYLDRESLITVIVGDR